MTPAARLQAAVEVLSAMDADSAAGDGVVRSYFRMRRYIGSKDRRDISSRLWRTVRMRSRLGWRLGQDEPTPRLLVFADSVLNEGQELSTVDGLCTGEGYAPEILDAAERAALTEASARSLDDMPYGPILQICSVIRPRMNSWPCRWRRPSTFA
jgi:16S rRNA (cytosine967-C5)-methyltransferase